MGEMQKEMMKFGIVTVKYKLDQEMLDDAMQNDSEVDMNGNEEMVDQLICDIELKVNNKPQKNVIVQKQNTNQNFEEELNSLNKLVQ